MLYTVNKKTPYHRANDDKEIFFHLSLKYSSSETGSHHSVPPFSAGTSIAM